MVHLIWVPILQCLWLSYRAQSNLYITCYVWSHWLQKQPCVLSSAANCSKNAKVGTQIAREMPSVIISAKFGLSGDFFHMHRSLRYKVRVQLRVCTRPLFFLPQSFLSFTRHLNVICNKLQSLLQQPTLIYLWNCSVTCIK